MLIDAHVHVFPPGLVRARARLCSIDPYFAALYSPRARMVGIEELLASMDDAGVDQSVVAGFGWCDLGICREHNAYIAEAVAAHPGRLIGLATANPRDRDAAEKELVRALEAGLKGIGELMPDAGQYAVDEPSIADMLGALAVQYGVPLLLHVSEPLGHAYPGKGTVALEQVVRLAERQPAVSIVCAHWGGGLPFYELMPEVARALQNVYYDTAAWPFLYHDRIFAAGAYMAPGKVIFATDYPLVSQSKALARVRASGISDEALAGVLGGTARRIYGGHP